MYKYLVLLLIIFSFFIGQAQLSGEYFILLSPFVLIMLFQNFFMIPGVLLAAGFSLYLAGGWFSLRYLLLPLFVYLFYQLYFKKLKTKKVFSLALLMALVNTILAFGVAYYKEIAVGQYIFYLLESVYFALITYYFNPMQISSFKKIKNNGPVGREKIIMLYIFSGFIIGFSSFYSIYTSFAANIILLMVIVLQSYYHGIASGVIIAVAGGLLQYVFGNIPINGLLKYIFPALIAGMINNKNRNWLMLSQLVSILLYSGFSVGYYEFKMSAAEIIASTGLIIAVPDYLARKISDYLKVVEKSYLAGTIDKEIVEDKTHYFINFQEIFSSISLAFQEALPVIEKEELTRTEDFIFIYKQKICKGCRRKRVCWEQEEDKTRRKLEIFLNRVENKNKLDKEVFDDLLAKRCDGRNVFIKARQVYELAMINNYWRDRLLQKQKIVADQLSSMTTMVEKFNPNSSSAYQYQGLYESISQRAVGTGLDLKDLIINYIPGRKSAGIEAHLEPCSGNQPCKKQLVNILSGELGENYRLISSECGSKLEEKHCKVKLGRVGNYNLEFAIAKKAEGEISGDNYTYQLLSDGIDVIILSDGMGTGLKAAEESRAACDLTRKLLNTGFSLDLALNTVNSTLYLRTPEENFTTIDIGYFDTFTGLMTFKKIGAMPSYIKRDWHVEEVEACNLPAGILKEIEIGTTERKLETGDFVIMISDGIINGNKKDNDWFISLLEKSSFTDTDEFASYIIEKASARKIKDDMTVIVLKIN